METEICMHRLDVQDLGFFCSQQPSDRSPKELRKVGIEFQDRERACSTPTARNCLRASVSGLL